jgi:hypothetical protein
MEGRTGSMISQEWVESTRTYFLEFLRMTKFPELTRHGESVGRCAYPEWLSMLIGVFAVNCTEKTYVGIHRLSTRFWKELGGEEVQAPPIAERRLRARLKKIRFQPGIGAGYMDQIFPPDDLRCSRQCGQADDPCSRAGLAS